jgi:hypothetical protein
VVRVGATRGQLLLVEDDGRVVPLSPRAEEWPADVHPRPGQAVLVGHRVLGGLHAGTVAGVTGGRLAIRPYPSDPRLPLEVVAP